MDMVPSLNPFNASLGVSPPVLVGRDGDIEDFSWALDSGPGSHERISLIKGTRGMGKTVLLNAFEDVARERGWHVISETATRGFVARIRDYAYRLLSQSENTEKARVRGFKFGSVGMDMERQEMHQPELTLRDTLTMLLESQVDRAARVGQEIPGLLITLDELHYLSRAEIIEFATTVQHLLRENRQIAVAMAGIPSAVEPLLSDKDGTNQLTFLRRANRIELRGVHTSEVRRGLSIPLQERGLSWEKSALDQAVQACAGYPFMIQLVGQWSVRYAASKVIDEPTVQAGVDKARAKLRQLVHEPAVADLSEKDRDFLSAMAEDEGPSSICSIAERLAVSSQYVNRYRERLLLNQMIYSPQRGYVDFALPYLREYMRES
ncbi:ATP-binding protein [Corynebacterium lowii]|uniref:Orc1-like AAA ATPase domain-containing protein n=1 Tax=Corynebacterium lowii TaxID=1544413 RepID=A0A0Q0UF74_9CORY|nr:ATP-binding protein [Corynebacterium lowii]KQB86647.1 hypothetical protein Clow_00855 [Corynebacterium lowii]